MTRRIFVISITLFVGFIGFAYAQAPATLTIDAAGGAIHTGEPCPNTRDNAIYASIVAGVACAQPGDTLQIAGGTYYENVLIDKDLTLAGTGTASTVVDGGGMGRVFTVENGVTATISDLTITGGVFDAGAGVYTYSGNIDLLRVIVSGNQAISGGGGVYVHSGRLSITDSTIANNNVHAFSNSGALADALGGGVYSYAGEVTISTSTLTGNMAFAETCGTTPANALGGAVYSHTASVTISDSTISGNVVEATACSPDVRTMAEGMGVFTFAGRVIFSGGSIEDVNAVGELGLIEDAAALVEPTSTQASASIPTATPLPATATPEITPIVVTEMVAVPPSVDTQFIVQWMQAIQVGVQEEKFSPPVAARIYAYTGVTLYEAVVPGLPDYDSLAGRLNGLTPLPQPIPELAYDWPLVANTALATVSANLFAGGSATTLDVFDTLREMIEFERGEVVPVNTFNRSREQGIAIGEAILAWAATDNYAATQTLTYNLPTGSPAYWVPLEGQKPLEPFWGTLRPFVLPLASACDVPPSVAFSIDPTSEFYAQADEVRAAVSNLTAEQQAIATFWADATGETSTPSGHWVSIENQMVDQLSLDLGRAAEMYALTGVALGDAFIATWEAKYRMQLVRPITYIQANIDPTWTIFISTPPFPEYPSGHSVASGAASTVLTGLFGTVAFDDGSHLGRALAPRSFSSFEAAAEEAAMSRVYGGIHYPFSVEGGLEQGRCVGRLVIDQLLN